MVCMVCGKCLCVLGACGCAVLKYVWEGQVIKHNTVAQQCYSSYTVLVYCDGWWWGSRLADRYVWS